MMAIPTLPGPRATRQGRLRFNRRKSPRALHLPLARIRIDRQAESRPWIGPSQHAALRPGAFVATREPPSAPSRALTSAARRSLRDYDPGGKQCQGMPPRIEVPRQVNCGAV